MFDYRIFYPQIGVEEQRSRRQQQRVTKLVAERRVPRQGGRR